MQQGPRPRLIRGAEPCRPQLYDWWAQRESDRMYERQISQAGTQAPDPSFLSPPRPFTTATAQACLVRFLFFYI